jgi:hypothetical protein
MKRISLFLAQLDIKDGVVTGLQKTGAGRNEFALLFGAVGLVTALVLAWAIFIRKRPDESSRRYRYRSSRGSAQEGAGTVIGSAGNSDARKEGRRRRRRKHRLRNPTLAETGGLPPLRADGYLEDPP